MTLPHEQRILVGVAEACKLIECCKSSLYNKINSGVLRAKKDGGRTLILVEDLRRYAESLPDMQPTQPS